MKVEWPDGPTYVGKGETFEDALQDAAEVAVRDSRENIDRKFEVVRHTVIVSNPRISQNKVVISATEP